MTSDCPHCRSSTETGSGGPLTVRCPACGRFLEPADQGPGSRDARSFGNSIHYTGVALDDGSAACPLAFGPYRVLRMIGKGGMGVVYLARHERTEDEVAIKTVRVRKRGMLHRIRREVHALARIEHPGLVRIIETGQSDGLPWYAMEFLQGKTLHDRLSEIWPDLQRTAGVALRAASGWDTQADFILALQTSEDEPWLAALAENPTVTLAQSRSIETTPVDLVSIPPSPETTNLPSLENVPGILADREPIPPLPPIEPIPEGEMREFLTLMARLCGTLAYLHGEGVVHRDIKPRNVIIRPDGTPVLLDFGLASFFGAEGRESLEVTGKIEGTPEYMSPEQIRGELVDARADLYAVGCLLYEGITGRVPFRGREPNDTLRSHVKILPLPPRDLNPAVPDPLNGMILHLLAKGVHGRLGYARDIIATLSHLGCDAGDWATDRPSRDYLYRPGFVGRGSFLADLESHVRRVLARPGHCIFLRGQSGVGKTRVILELARLFEQEHLTVVTGECLPIGVGGHEKDEGPDVRATPLHPFRSFLQTVVDSCLERGPDEVARLLGARGSVLAQCEPSLASLPGLGDDCGPCPEDDSLHSRLIEAMGETLAEFGRTSPVVIFLDDLEWADALTLHFLALFHVGAWDSPNVAIVAAYRSEEEDDALKGYRPVFQDATFVDVGPLDEPSLGEIVRDMLGSHQVDDRFVRHLAHRSGGNPFFVAEYLRAAVAEGLLFRDGSGRWRTQSEEDGAELDLGPDALDAAIPLPSSLHELVVRRLSGLSLDTRHLLELAAIIGREVDSDLLESVGLLGETETMTAIEALLVAQVLEESRDGHFRFAHDKLREVSYEQIPPARRRTLHRSVALALETRCPDKDDRSRISATLAHHWYRSIGDHETEPEAVDRALEYLVMSIRQAVNGGLTAEAVEFGRAAARLVGVVLPEGPTAIAAAMAAEMGKIRAALIDRAPADLVDLPSSDDPRVDRAIGLLLTIHPPAFISNQIALFALMASKNLSLTLAHGHGPLAPSVYAMFAIVNRIVLDDAQTAREYAALAIELDRRTGGTQTADILFLKSWFVDHWVAPIRDVLPGCDAGARAGLATSEVLYGCYNHGAYVALLAASGATLAEVVQEAESRLSLVGQRVLVARFHCVLERQFALALAGRTDGPSSLSDQTFDESRDLAFICRTTNANQMGYYHVARLKLLYYRGDYKEALAAADLALSVWESFARQPAEVDLAFFHALALLASTPTESGSKRTEHLATAHKHLTALVRWRVDCEVNFAHKALLVEAEIARVESRPDEAGRLFEAAARSAEAAGFAPHTALAWERAANHRVQLGDPAGAEPLRRQAIAHYRAWGASTIADRLARN